jgi:integrase
MQELRQTFWYPVEYTRLHEDRTARSGQNTHATGNRAFVQRRFAIFARSHPFWSLSLTACRIAEACSLMVKDIYTNSGAVRSTINFRKANTKGKLQTRTIPVIEDLRSLADILAFPRRPNLFIPRPPPFPPLEAFAPRLSGQDSERSVLAGRHRGSIHPQF